jgi:hypothetical protein
VQKSCISFFGDLHTVVFKSLYLSLRVLFFDFEVFKLLGPGVNGF